MYETLAGNWEIRASRYWEPEGGAYTVPLLSLSLSRSLVPPCIRREMGCGAKTTSFFPVCNCSFYKALIPDFRSDKALSKDWALGRNLKPLTSI